MSIATDLQAAINQLPDRRFAFVLIKALGLTVGCLVAVTWGLMLLLGAWLPETLWLPFVGEVTVWTGLLTGAALILMLGLSAFLMVPVAALSVGFFLDDIVAAVEEKHYPGLPPIDPLPFGDVLLDSLRFALTVVVANILALVIYLLSSLLAPFIFWAVNGYLLGREYFQLVAGRRIGVKAATRLRRRNRGEIWLAGALLAIPLTIPIINLLIPVIGVAAYTHMFHRLNAARTPQDPTATVYTA